MRDGKVLDLCLREDRSGKKVRACGLWECLKFEWKVGILIVMLQLFKYITINSASSENLYSQSGLRSHIFNRNTSM